MLKMVVDGGVRGEEPLCRAWGSETATLSLPTARRLVRNVCPVVRPPTCHMAIGQAKVAQSRTIGSQSIRDDCVGHVSQPSQKSPQELESRLPVTPRLHEDVKNFALIVNRTPEIMDLATDPDEDLVQMPAARGLWSALANPLGICAAEFERSPATGLIRNVDTPFRKQVLDIPVTQGEAKIEPDGMLNDLARKPMAGIRNSAHADPCRAKLASPTQLT